mmetsp:Transcript_4684/g.13002  ORF Transcript_4684/g.13002 Transcript_4684/m.13002 type:complete len:215 (-) Transcript_4684:2076-2720(-)
MPRTLGSRWPCLKQQRWRPPLTVAAMDPLGSCRLLRNLLQHQKQQPVERPVMTSRASRGRWSPLRRLMAMMAALGAWRRIFRPLISLQQQKKQWATGTQAMPLGTLRNCRAPICRWNQKQQPAESTRTALGTFGSCRLLPSLRRQRAVVVRALGITAAISAMLKSRQRCRQRSWQRDATREAATPALEPSRLLQISQLRQLRYRVEKWAMGLGC